MSGEAQEIDWEIRFSQSRQRPYFYSNKTKKSVWDQPPELSNVDLMKLPGSNLLQGSNGSNGENQKKVRASHLLVKHNRSRRPSSWKEEKITRSKEEAIEILKRYESELVPLKSSPNELLAQFSELAKLHSDCSSHSNGGDLGQFGRCQMQKPFEDVSFNLQVCEMSSIVETDSGVHLILRTG